MRGLLLFALLLGCNAPEKALLGAWEMDFEAMAANDAKLGQLPPAVQKKAIAQAKRNSMRFEFGEGGRMTVSLGGAPASPGTYEILGSDGDALKLRYKGTEKGQDTPEEATAVVAGKTLVFTVKGHRMRFKRVEP